MPAADAHAADVEYLLHTRLGPGAARAPCYQSIPCIPKHWPRFEIVFSIHLKANRTRQSRRSELRSARRVIAGRHSTVPLTGRTSWRLAKRSVITGAKAASTGPLFIGIDAHGLSEPALASALEVFAANDVNAMVDERGGYTPTPVVSHAILSYNKNRKSGLADESSLPLRITHPTTAACFLTLRTGPPVNDVAPRLLVMPILAGSVQSSVPSASRCVAFHAAGSCRREW